MLQGCAKNAENEAEAAQLSLQTAADNLAKQREAGTELAEKLRSVQSDSEAATLKVCLETLHPSPYPPARPPQIWFHYRQRCLWISENLGRCSWSTVAAGRSHNSMEFSG
jgi:hypothetical protein